MIYQLLIVEFILILIMYILSNRCFISPAFIAIALFFWRHAVWFIISNFGMCNIARRRSGLLRRGS